jgi:hypothetical protein
MPDDINPQIVNAVSATMVAVVGTAPAASQALAYEALAHSLTLMMQNAVQAQFGMLQLETASVATTCALIASKASA